MKTKTCLLPTLALAVCTTSAVASYSIPWWTIAGGGGTSTNGQYSVSGTIGQHDAGAPATNGAYSLTGGFWALPQLVQTPGAPMLQITRGAPGYAMLSWTPNTPGYVLQSSPRLDTPSWTDAPTGTNNPASVPATVPARFYRLQKP